MSLSKSLDINVWEPFCVNNGLIIIVCCCSRGFHSECQIDISVDVVVLLSKRWIGNELLD